MNSSKPLMSSEVSAFFPTPRPGMQAKFSGIPPALPAMASLGEPMIATILALFQSHVRCHMTEGGIVMTNHMEISSPSFFSNQLPGPGTFLFRDISAKCLNLVQGSLEKEFPLKMQTFSKKTLEVQLSIKPIYSSRWLT